MGEINKEDIAGVYAGEKLFCNDCHPDDPEMAGAVLLRQTIEDNPDKLYFCDQCGKAL